VLAGLDTGSVLPNLQAILNSERNRANVFATVCDATISTDRAHVRLRVAGHPAPMLINRGAGLLDVQRVGPPLGVVEGMVWDEEQFALAPGWSLLFYTDGIIEGHRRGDLSGRWGTEGVISAIEREAPPGAEPSALVDLLLAAAELENGGPLADDIALFLLVDAR
jgi:serine phosphatase RsbU (regulator of sigma subunit)